MYAVVYPNGSGHFGDKYFTNYSGTVVPSVGLVQIPGQPYMTIIAALGNQIQTEGSIPTQSSSKIGDNAVLNPNSATSSTLPLDITNFAGPFVGNLGDGPKADFLFVSPSGQLVICKAAAAPTCRVDQLPASPPISPSSADYVPAWSFVDLNQDGYEDLVATTADTVFVYTNNKLGTGWILSQINLPDNMGAISWWKQTYWGDFNGDGIVDMYRKITNRGGEIHDINLR